MEFDSTCVCVCVRAHSCIRESVCFFPTCFMQSIGFIIIDAVFEQVFLLRCVLMRVYVLWASNIVCVRILKFGAYLFCLGYQSGNGVCFTKRSHSTENLMHTTLNIRHHGLIKLHTNFATLLYPLSLFDYIFIPCWWLVFGCVFNLYSISTANIKRCYQTVARVALNTFIIIVAKIKWGIWFDEFCYFELTFEIGSAGSKCFGERLFSNSTRWNHNFTKALGPGVNPKMAQADQVRTEVCGIRLVMKNIGGCLQCFHDCFRIVKYYRRNWLIIFIIYHTWNMCAYIQTERQTFPFAVLVVLDFIHR